MSISSNLSQLASAQTLQERYALAWHYLTEAQPAKNKKTPSGYHSPWMCWRMLYLHAGQGTKAVRINKSQCWEIVAAFCE